MTKNLYFFLRAVLSDVRIWLSIPAIRMCFLEAEHRKAKVV